MSYLANSSDGHNLSFEAMTDRLPPQSIETEESILGGVLLDPDALSRVNGILKPEAFYVGAHRRIFEAMLFLNGMGEPTDMITVAMRLADTGQLEKIGGQAKLVQLVDRTVSAVNIDRYAALVMEKYLRRRMIAVSQEIEGLARNTAIDLSEVLEQAEQKLFSVTSERPNETGLWNDQLAPKVYDEVEARVHAASLKRQQGTQVLSGTPTGYYDLDAQTQGLSGGDLIIVAGRPSMGKSALAMQIAYNIATGCLSNSPAQSVAIFSLEMKSTDVFLRHVSSESGRLSPSDGVPLSSLRSGEIGDKQWGGFMDAYTKVAGANIYMDSRPCPSVAEIASTSRQVAAERGGLGLVVVDYLQIMCKTNDETLELGRITRGLKRLAMELNVPVVALSQLSRAVESRQDKRPMMSDLRQSGSIEQDADLILMMYRDEYYNPDTPERGIAEVNIAKNRNGATGVVKLLFQKEYTAFRNTLNR